MKNIDLDTSSKEVSMSRGDAGGLADACYAHSPADSHETKSPTLGGLFFREWSEISGLPPWGWMRRFYFPEELVVALESAFGLPFNKNYIKRHRRFHRGYIAAALKGAFRKTSSGFWPPPWLFWEHAGSPFSQWHGYYARSSRMACKENPPALSGGFTDLAAQGHRCHQVCWHSWGQHNMFMQPCCVKVSCVLLSGSDAQLLQQGCSYTRHPLGAPRCGGASTGDRLLCGLERQVNDTDFDTPTDPSWKKITCLQKGVRETELICGRELRQICILAVSRQRAKSGV